MPRKGAIRVLTCSMEAVRESRELQNAIAEAANLIDLAHRYDRSRFGYLVRAIEALHRHPSLNSHLLVRLFDGSVMYVNAREEAGCAIFLYKTYETGLTRFFVDFLKVGNVAVDVGAHHGYFSVIASRLVGASGKVHAFEPTKEAVFHLKSNTLHLMNVQVHETSLGDVEGDTSFNDYGAEHSASNSILSARLRNHAIASQLTVHVSCLDDFFKDGESRPNLVKIDAESSESLVPRGMGDLLGQVEALIVEVGDFDELISSGVPTTSALLHFVRSFGYELY